LPNARWLWLEREDLALCLTLARLLSKARAKKLDVAGSDEPLPLDRVREAIAGMSAPGEWQSVVSITRWLSDVPRETHAVRALPRDEGRPALEASEIRQAPVAISPAPASPPASERPSPTLRAWLAMGRDLGRSALSRYVQKVRTVVGRTEE
jgi:hypothetical protein